MGGERRKGRGLERSVGEGRGGKEDHRAFPSSKFATTPLAITNEYKITPRLNIKCNKTVAYITFMVALSLKDF